MTVLNCPDPRALASFYEQVLSWRRIDDDESWTSLGPSPEDERLGFQRAPDFIPPSWPENPGTLQTHTDLYVDDIAAEHERVTSLGANLIDGSHENFRVYSDPAGHLFCLCIPPSER